MNIRIKRIILISVIIPIYKVEKYLNKCVESVVNQSYKNIEIILVDDGSPDNCPQMCDDWARKDSRIKVIHKENGGLTTVRKVGAQLATGDYIVFVDSDDWIDKDYLQQFINVIDKYHPDIVLSDYLKYYSDKSIYYCKQLYNGGFYSKEDIKRVIYPSLVYLNNGISFQPTSWAKIIKTELFRKEQIPISDKIRYGDDTVCIIPCVYNAKNLYILNKGNYYYRINPNSQCNAPKPFPQDYPFEVYKHLISRLKTDEYDFKPQILRRLISDLFAMSVSQFYASEPYRVIKKKVLNLLSNDIAVEAINNAKCPELKLKVKQFILKNKIVSLMCCICKYKLIKRIIK